MPTDTMHRHNGGPLNDDDQRKLLNHVRAIEVLEEQEQDIRDDKKVRKELAKKDGFDTKILDAIVKRRKLGQGETRAADHLIRLYEDALEEEGMLPLEETRRAIQPRRTLEEISRATHGQDLGEAAPPTHEPDPEDARRAIEKFRRKYPDVTISVVKPTPPAADPPDDDPF